MASKEKKAQKKAAEAKAAQRKKRIILICAAAAVIAIAVVLVLVLRPAAAPAATDAPTFSPDTTIYADIDIKDYGTVTIRLETQKAPITCENFISLVESGFYNGLTFHRIMEGFMMQGGDPNGNGTGGSGKNITGEFADNGHKTGLSHTRGAVSMARSAAYNSASSQFFIVHQDSTFLDGSYAVFGYVTEGMDVVDAVCTAAKPTDSNGTIPAAQQPVITSARIRYE